MLDIALRMSVRHHISPKENFDKTILKEDWAITKTYCPKNHVLDNSRDSLHDLVTKDQSSDRQRLKG